MAWRRKIFNASLHIKRQEYWSLNTMNTINQLGIIFTEYSGFSLGWLWGKWAKMWGKRLRDYTFWGSLLIFQPKFLNIEKKRHEQSLLYFFDFFNISIWLLSQGNYHHFITWTQMIQANHGNQFNHVDFGSLDIFTCQRANHYWLSDSVSKTNIASGAFIDDRNTMIEISLKDCEQKWGNIWSINKSKLAATDEIE